MVGCMRLGIQETHPTTRNNCLKILAKSGIAYFAEFSNIFLRLSNFLRRRPVNRKTLRPEHGSRPWGSQLSLDIQVIAGRDFGFGIKKGMGRSDLELEYQSVWVRRLLDALGF